MFNSMHLNYGQSLCIKHAQRALRAFKASFRLKPFINDGTMILPEKTDIFCFPIKMPVGDRVLTVSFSVPLDRAGNRYELGEINEQKPPCTLEILLFDNHKKFKEYYHTLGYGDTLSYEGEPKTFDWDHSLIDSGFEQITDELIRIRDIINGHVDDEEDEEYIKEEDDYYEDYDEDEDYDENEDYEV